MSRVDARCVPFRTQRDADVLHGRDARTGMLFAPRCIGGVTHRAVAW
jgi:hypothetical protein